MRNRSVNLGDQVIAARIRHSDYSRKGRISKRTFATLDDIIPTTDQSAKSANPNDRSDRRSYADLLTDEAAVQMIRNAKEYGEALSDL